MADKCLVRIEDALTKSGFDKDDAGSILKQIKKAETDSKLKEADDALNAATAKQILEKTKIQKQINKLNAIEDEIKIRDWVEWNLTSFKENPKEGLTAILVVTGKKWVQEIQLLQLKTLITKI